MFNIFIRDTLLILLNVFKAANINQLEKLSPF